MNDKNHNPELILLYHHNYHPAAGDLLHWIHQNKKDANKNYNSLNFFRPVEILLRAFFPGALQPPVSLRDEWKSKIFGCKPGLLKYLLQLPMLGGCMVL